jgi:hypothetical protein
LNIKQIYTTYNVPPNLQQHMLRVAAFSKMIIENWKVGNPINEEIIVKSCLLHDLGNIMKFDFDNFPELLGDEIVNLDYWKGIKRKMAEKYGKDEDKATVNMVKELGIGGEILFIVENWGFKNFTRIERSDNWNWKIAVYADHRISPDGITSLRQNFENKQSRYKVSKHDASHISEDAMTLFNSALQVESSILPNTTTNLYNISTEKIDILGNTLLGLELC